VSLVLPDTTGMVKAWGMVHDRTVASTLAIGRRTGAGATQVDRRGARDAAPMVAAADLAVYALATPDLTPQLFVWNHHEDADDAGRRKPSRRRRCGAAG
jgi:hypothetical protein